MTHYLGCLLCGIEGPQIRMRLVEWETPVGSTRFEVIPACSNVTECRQRVAQLNETWPLVRTKLEETP